MHACVQPWLIEVNASPSLSANTQKDHDMKVQMLTSMLDIIDMEKKSDGIRHQVGGFDLIYHNGVGASLLRVLGPWPTKQRSCHRRWY